MDREKVIKDNAIRGLQSAIEISGALVHLRKEHAKAILELLKEQDELLHKKQKDIDRLCNEISEWKHKFHDKSLKEQEDEKKRIMKVIWDTLHEGLSIDTVADQDWVYEQIRHRVEDT